MKNYKKIIIGLAAVLIVALAAILVIRRKSEMAVNNTNTSQKADNNIPVQSPSGTNILQDQNSLLPVPTEIKYVGPRGNVPAGAPNDYGFWSFAVVAPGLLSRSGQPSLTDFKWLKDNGWKSDVDLRIDGDHNEVADDAQIPGFNALDFNYLRIQMVDGAAPTDDQAQQFLTFVTNPANQPAHVHCRGGIGRAGVMVALYRYAINGWPVDKAIEESKLFQGGIDAAQQKWLKNWATNHAPGAGTQTN